MVRYGDVYWIELPEYSEHIMAKKRPCVVVSNDFQNYGANTVQVCPLTSNEKRLDLPCHISTNFGMVKCEQIITIDKDSVGHRMGTLNEVEMRQIKTALMTQLGII